MSLTLLMTTYNCAEYISQAIKSVLKQTYKEYEFLIIDDGSDDNTEEIINSFNDSRIKFIKIKHSGKSIALNIGLNEAKYELISLCDADDIIHPQKIEKQIVQYKDENDLIFTNTAYFRKNKILFLQEINKESKSFYKKIVLHGQLNSSVLMNKNFILKNSGFNQELSAFEDYDLWLRILNKSNIKIIPELLYYQRLRKNSLSTSDTMKKKHIIYKIQEPYFEKLEQHINISLQSEQLLLKGWREFFYGNKNLSRKLWLNASLKNWDYRNFICFFLTYLPNSFLDKIKNKRFRLRFEYQFKKIFDYQIQNEFEKILELINEQ